MNWKRRSRSRLRETIEVIAVSFLLAVLVRTYVVCGYKVPSGSMEDTLLVGDHFLACRFYYRITDPKPGDVIVFQYPLDTGRDFVKRVAAVGGQTIEIRDKQVLIDGVLAPHPGEAKHIDSRIYRRGISTRDNLGPLTVPPGYVFVLGDNRDNSQDSRYWGLLDRRLIKGKAFLLYWSWEGMRGDPQLAQLEDPILVSLPRTVLSLFRVLVFEVSHIPWRVRWNRVGRLITA
jgi:signal peptidase I